MDDLRQLDPNRLDTLLRVGHSASDWRAQDLQAALRHQLAVRIDFDSADWPAFRPGERGFHSATLEDLLTHPAPPLVLLRRIKSLAKECRHIECAALPTATATVLYLAAIVAARLGCGEWITALDEAQLRERIEWALAQPWLLPSIRRLLELGQRRLWNG